MEKTKIIFAAALMAYTCSHADASEIKPFVDGSKPFVAIGDVNREAEAWGMCAAAYDVAAMLFEDEKPNQARRFRDFGNGAAISAVMANVVKGLNDDMSPEEFNNLWNYSKTLAASIPETSKTAILAELESAEDMNAALEKITKTIEICVSNLNFQQDYIYAWRELAKSGLITNQD